MFSKAGVEMRHPFSGRQREAAEEGLGVEEGDMVQFAAVNGSPCRRAGGRKEGARGWPGLALGLWAWGQGI